MGWVHSTKRNGSPRTPRSATKIGAFIGFELGTMFVPYGRIVSLDAYRALIEIPECIGAKHSSLSRQMEWDRLQLHDEVRPDFMVLTGNDLAIDMVMWGSDYLLGLSTFAPAEFALATDSGRPATRPSTNSTTCCSTSASSRSARLCPATATMRPCASGSADGRPATTRQRVCRVGRRAIAMCWPTSSAAWRHGHDPADPQARLARSVPPRTSVRSEWTCPSMRQSTRPVRWRSR